MTKRYKHILVPLDGSKLAELALSEALAMAELSGADLTLLQAIPVIDDILESGEHELSNDNKWGEHEARACEYLNSVCDRLAYENLTIHKVVVAVVMASTAATIIDYAHEHSIDLIVMATHGRSGLQRWVFGSVTDKVLRGANIPILLVRANPNSEGLA